MAGEIATNATQREIKHWSRSPRSSVTSSLNTIKIDRLHRFQCKWNIARVYLGPYLTPLLQEEEGVIVFEP